MHGVLALRRGAQHVPCFRIKVQQLMLNFSNESDAVFCGRAFAAWRKVVALDRVRLSRNQQVSRVILSETAAGPKKDKSGQKNDKIDTNLTRVVENALFYGMR